MDAVDGLFRDLVGGLAGRGARVRAGSRRIGHGVTLRALRSRMTRWLVSRGFDNRWSIPVCDGARGRSALHQHEDEEEHERRHRGGI